MDPRKSPYAPGAGTKPTVLAGRTYELERFSVLMDRLERGRSAEALLFAGSRGMGKTVLLHECKKRALDARWFTAFQEVDPQHELRKVMALNAQDVLYDMRASKRYGERLRRALGVLKAFTSIGVLGVTLKIDVDLIPGTADSGIFKRDLLALFTELGQVAASDGSGVVFLLDELHTLRGTEEMAGLDAVIHGMAQAGLPVTAVGAGVFRGPGYRAPGDAQTPSTYAGRLYRIVRLQPLAREIARQALAEPTRELGVAYDEGALRLAIEFADGSPWFLQLIGEEAWEGAPSESRITEADVRTAIPRAHARLDEDFYPRLMGRATSEPEGCDVLNGLVRLGGVAVSRDELAQHVPRAELREILNYLIGRDIIEVAEPGKRRYSFTVPGISEYLRRVGIAPDETNPQ